jgi:uncharacterized protein
MQPDDPQLYDRLAAVIAPRGRIVTAFSGGVDSTLVAAVARRTLGKVAAPAAVGDSASLPRRELDGVRQLAAALDIDLIELNPGEQDDASYQQNAGDRCYFCKSHLYDALQRLAAEQAIDFIANGTNVDDLGDHRPGLRAADEAKVISPLLEAGFGKQQVRELAQTLELPNWDKPAAACLASRLPVGTPVTTKRLSQVEQAEDALAAMGLRGVRVRHHDTIARIELPLDQLDHLLAHRGAIIDAVKAAGFKHVTLDLDGYRQGGADVSLTVSARR